MSFAFRSMAERSCGAATPHSAKNVVASVSFANDVFARPGHIRLSQEGFEGWLGTAIGRYFLKTFPPEEP